MDSREITDKIDEEIVELRNIKKMNGGSVEKVKTNISLMMSNLYFRMKWLADFIRSDNQMDEKTGKKIMRPKNI